MLYKLGQELLQEADAVLTKSPQLQYEDNGYIEASSQSDLLKYHPEVVLYRPQIPQNTGSIARLCAAFSATLHLVGPMGFQITEKKVRRAGLDYWEYVNLYLHENWDNFVQTRSQRRYVFVETGEIETPVNFQFLPGDLLIFGAETFGIHKEVITEAKQKGNAYQITIPMFNRGVRSINLANTVSIVLYQAIARLH